VSYSQVRTYVRSRVFATCPELKEWKDAFNFQNIPNDVINTYYHIEYGPVSTLKDDATLEDSMTLTVRVFKKAYGETSDEMDSIMDKALCMRQAIISKVDVAQTDNIREIEGSLITPLAFDDSNDNIIQVDLEFNVRLYFCS